MVYVWKSVSFEGVDANKVGKELEKLEKEKEVLTRQNVLERAKDKSTELHKCFEWDDKIAGEKFRLQQANFVLSSISVKIEEKEPTRYYVSIKTASDERVYKNVKAVVQNEDEYRQLIERAKSEFISYKQKYEKMVDKAEFKKMILDNL